MFFIPSETTVVNDKMVVVPMIIENPCLIWTDNTLFVLFNRKDWTVIINANLVDNRTILLCLNVPIDGNNGKINTYVATLTTVLVEFLNVYL